MTGRNKVNAMKMKKAPVASNSPKYNRAFPDGMLLVADCKLPGKSLTPFVTTLKVPETVSLADLTADSMSNPVRKELVGEVSSEALAAAYEFQSASNDGDVDGAAAEGCCC